MQVPAGKPLAGHGPPQDARPELDRPAAARPQDDPQPRELHPPSTAATLNLAATAAQCARLFAPYDAAFADPLPAPRRRPRTRRPRPTRRVLRRPERRQRRRRLQRRRRQRRVLLGRRRAVPDHRRAGVPGRPDRLAAPHRRRVRRAAGFGWGSTAALGRLDLATVPNGLPAADRHRVRAVGDRRRRRLPGHAARPGVRAADARRRGQLLLGRQQQHHQQRGRAGHRVRPDRRRRRTATARCRRWTTSSAATRSTIPT